MRIIAVRRTPFIFLAAALGFGMTLTAQAQSPLDTLQKWQELSNLRAQQQLMEQQTQLLRFQMEQQRQQMQEERLRLAAGLATTLLTSHPNLDYQMFQSLLYSSLAYDRDSSFILQRLQIRPDMSPTEVRHTLALFVLGTVGPATAQQMMMQPMWQSFISAPHSTQPNQQTRNQNNCGTPDEYKPCLRR